MAQLSSEIFDDKDLAEWKEIASGGFGTVYRVNHKVRGFVAIKLLRQSTGTNDELLKEADCLRNMSSQFVLTVYGIYRGHPPKEKSEQKGIVMEFMKRGSIHTLQKDLCGPPPLPLAVQLAYQVAKGMQHLHSKNLLHHDLKPSNVLLDNDFNAKLADFGLSRVTTSVYSYSEQSKGGASGTFQYFPPEAFNLNYKSVRSFDVYSYGILLWSILSGNEPYEGKVFSLVELRIPKGDRPNVSLCLKEEEEKKEEMIKLMKRCWDGEPSNRPDFNEIITDIEPMFSVHKDGIYAAIQEVLSKLEQNSNSSYQLHQANAAALVPSSTPGNEVSNDIVDHPKVAIQQPTVSAGAENLTEKDKARFVDDMRDDIVQKNTHVMEIAKELLDMGMVHEETYANIEAKKTNQEKMRELFQTSLKAGGERVKAAFYDAWKNPKSNMLNSRGAS